MKKIRLALITLSLGAAALLWLNSRPVRNPFWEQPTMGTACHITIAGPVSKTELAALHKQIDAALEDVNARMSIWNANTEISKFNRFQSLEKFPVSPEFAEVVQSALSYSALTGGAFDPTVKPLVEHWGFGPQADAEPVETIMQAVGWQKLKLADGALTKLNPKVQLDLAAIAKGYGVDRVAGVLRANGRRDFIVEIGGEIVADGANRSGKPWRVGIESPEAEGKAFGSEIFRSVELSGEAMATSGDYRNFQTRADGTRFSHIIDPHSGRPAQSDVAAVTVIAAHCMDADAVATSLCVMGSESGFQWLEKHPEFQAFFILHTADGRFISKATAGFPQSN